MNYKKQPKRPRLVACVNAYGSGVSSDVEYVPHVGEETKLIDLQCLIRCIYMFGDQLDYKYTIISIIIIIINIH